MNRIVLALSLALSIPAFAKGPARGHGEPIKLPKFVSFGRGNVALPKGHEQTLGIVKAYLLKHPEVTKLRIEGYWDEKDTNEQAEQKAKARALAVASWLTHHGVDCKRLIAVHFNPTNGAKKADMREGGAYVTFVNAELRGKPIGGAPLHGGGTVSDNVCAG